MNDAAELEKLRALVLVALKEADRQQETLVGCLIAQSLDAIGRRLDENCRTGE